MILKILYRCDYPNCIAEGFGTQIQLPFMWEHRLWGLSGNYHVCAQHRFCSSAELLKLIAEQVLTSETVDITTSNKQDS